MTMRKPYTSAIYSVKVVHPYKHFGSDPLRSRKAITYYYIDLEDRRTHNKSDTNSGTEEGHLVCFSKRRNSCTEMLGCSFLRM